MAKAIENPLGAEAEELRQTFPEKQRAEATKVLQGIRDYRVPTYVIETNQEDEQTVSSMARAFIQLNRQGVRISNIELLLSLLAGTWKPEIRHEIEAAYGGLDQYGLDLQPFLRLTLGGLGLSQNVVSKPEQFEHAVRGLAHGPLGDSVQRAAQAMKSTLTLLREDMGISDLSIVPSQVTLVPPAFFFQTKGITPDELSEGQRRQLSAWFLLANFKGRYSGAVDTKLERDLRVVAESKDDFPFEKLMQAMRPADQRISWSDFERARRVNAMRTGGRHYLFLLFTLLVKNNATDWTERLLRATPW